MEQNLSDDRATISSRIGLGTWSIGGWMWGGSDETEAVKTIRTTLELGVTLIDTAPAYGFGRSEELVGRALWPARRPRPGGDRDQVGLRAHAGAVHRDASARRIQTEIEDSLRRLKTSYIDVYQVHWPDPLVPVGETAAALLRLDERGTIRAIGVSNFSPEQIEMFRAVAPVHVIQSPYNLFERGIEHDVLPYARRQGIAVFAYGALCRGLLSGRMRADTRFTGDDLRQDDPKFQLRRYRQYLGAVAALERLARQRYGRSVLALAVRWILDQGASVALWGARKPEQLAPIGEVSGWRVDFDTRTMIDSILAETITDPVGPDFMAPPARPSPRCRRAARRRARMMAPAGAAFVAVVVMALLVLVSSTPGRACKMSPAGGRSPAGAHGFDEYGGGEYRPGEHESEGHFGDVRGWPAGTATRGPCTRTPRPWDSRTGTTVRVQGRTTPTWRDVRKAGSPCCHEHTRPTGAVAFIDRQSEGRCHRGPRRCVRTVKVAQTGRRNGP